MDVFGAGIEIRPLKEPGMCFLCEMTPIQETDRVINTMRIFSPGPMTNLNGTKYVCESCATDLGKAIGLIAPAEYQAVKDSLDKAEAEVASLTTSVTAYAALDTAVKQLAAVAETPEVVKADAKA